jgi:hypothetical protein
MKLVTHLRRVKLIVRMVMMMMVMGSSIVRMRIVMVKSQ